VDYRLLNHITRVPALSIPNAKEMLQRMGGHKMNHTFDMQNAYHCLEIAEEDQEKTAIVLPDDLGLPAREFQFTRLSFVGKCCTWNIPICSRSHSVSCKTKETRT